MLKNKKFNWGGGFIKGLVPLILAVFLFGSGILVLWATTLKIPDLSSFEERKVSQSTKIYDKTGGVLLYDVHQDIRRTLVPFNEISPNIVSATVAIEDASFYSHEGVRFDAIIRATLKNIVSGSFSQGGSTITQQVIKNAVLTPEKKISRKIKEWVLAFKLEQEFSKDEIIEIYLNETPYGGNVYGVEEAAKNFFGKSAKDVSVAEAAYLASLPKAPTYFSPYGSHRDELEERKNTTLLRMFESGFINEEEYSKALKEEVSFQPKAEFGIRAPHFVFFVREYLVEKYGEETVEEGGLKVITTLDWDLQEKAEKIVKERAFYNKENYNAENAGLVAIEPKTGQILVMVGSRDYFDKEIPGAFNVATTHRQPGSAFKPVVYAAALEKGYTPETVVFDLKTQFSTACSPTNLSNSFPCYSPSNYDNSFRGPVTFREALAQSLNIPSVKVLYLTGLDAALSLAKKLGIESLENKDQYGLTLVLGGGEVSLLDLTSAYSVFANDGLRNPYVPVLKVEDNNGRVLEEFKKGQQQRALPEQTARQISDILSDNVARTPAFGANSLLYVQNQDVAVKTGTTNDYRDAWIVGYTPEIAVGAWAGNNDNSPMEKRIAGFIITPLWREFINEALVDLPKTNFTKPLKEDVVKPVLRGIWQGGKTFMVDGVSGDLISEFTPEETREERIITSVHSILYWVSKNNPRGPYPENPNNDPQFKLWEWPVRIWAQTRGFGDEDESVLPDDIDNIHTKDSSPEIEVVVSKDEFSSNEEVFVSVLVVDSKEDVQRVDYFVNNKLIGSSEKNPDFGFVFVPNQTNSVPGNNTLTAVAYDDVLNRGSDSVGFEIKN